MRKIAPAMHGSVAWRTRLLDPCQRCRGADRQQVNTVVLLSEVADGDSADAISPALAPGAFPNPPRARGPAATPTELTGPVAEDGTGRRNKTQIPLRGHTREGDQGRVRDVLTT